MATNRIEEYLEAILAKIADGTDTTVPAPAWRIEEYLAAIYSALSNGGGSGGDVLVVTDTDGTLDKTWSEIDAADVAVISASKNGGTFHPREFVFSTIVINGDYIVNARGVGNTDYLTNSADGYPVLQE